MQWVHTSVPRISWKATSLAATLICMYLKKEKLIGIRCVDNGELSEYLQGQEHRVHCLIAFQREQNLIS